ncbi:MAG: hypothetical protein Q9209_005704 [Squamulea sp. 1 TL-2023]
MAPTSHLLNFLPRQPSRHILLSFSLPSLFATATMSTSLSNSPPTYTITPIHPPSPSTLPLHEPLQRMDPTPDDIFYSQPRFVTHIDDAAIGRLREYYRWDLLTRADKRGIAKERSGRVLDLCASWVSHFPTELEEAATRTARRIRNGVAEGDNGAGGERGDGGGREDVLEVVGLGMNREELAANPVLSKGVVQDLNDSPNLPSSISSLDATTCVVSIDYLTCPVTVLRSILSATKAGGTIHLVISNRCFPTKVAGDWLKVGEQERLQLVGRYLWWAGWKGVEVVDLCPRKEEGKGKEGVLARLRGMMGGGGDPLWVVRGVKGDEAEEEARGEGRGLVHVEL